MTEIIAIKDADDLRDVVHRTCEVLCSGGIAILPTETRYVQAALATQTAAVQTIAAASSAPPSLLLRSFDHARDYVLSWSRVAARLGRRAWPGPVALQVPAKSLGGYFRDLPAPTQSSLLAAANVLTLRVTAHPFVTDLQRFLPAPLVISSDVAGGDRPPAAHDAWAEPATLVLNDGPSRYSEPLTVVLLQDQHWHVVQPGVVSELILSRLASEVILFVCTGNTCRSPMAEALMRRRLSERLGCADDELVDRGFIVLSAGVAAAHGAPASREAVELLGREGIDLRGHGSTPLTSRLLDHADRVLTMTAGHRYAILDEHPGSEGRVRLLSHSGADVADPIGGGSEEYRACRDEIDREVRLLVDSLVEVTE